MLYYDCNVKLDWLSPRKTMMNLYRRHRWRSDAAQVAVAHITPSALNLKFASYLGHLPSELQIQKAH
jgi:hypothetical protein